MANIRTDPLPVSSPQHIGFHRFSSSHHSVLTCLANTFVATTKVQQRAWQRVRWNVWIISRACNVHHARNNGSIMLWWKAFSSSSPPPHPRHLVGSFPYGVVTISTLVICFHVYGSVSIDLFIWNVLFAYIYVHIFKCFFELRECASMTSEEGPKNKKEWVM